MSKIIFQLPKFKGSRFLMKSRVKTAVGGLLSSFGLVLAGSVYPMTAVHSQVAAQEPGDAPVVIETLRGGPALTVPNYIRISQGFYALHPGVDITAKEGSPIYPVKAGRVVKISVSRYEYGRSVIVEHEDGVTSLYAHMGKIKVDEGQKVTEKTQLGEVGLTGRTTGYHLHLEVYKNGRAINPLKYIRGA